MLYIIGLILSVFSILTSLFMINESVFRKIAYRIPILGDIVVWLLCKSKEFVIWSTKRFYKYFLILMKIEFDNRIEFVLRAHTRWNVIHEDFPEILEKYFLNDAKEFYKAYREILIEKRIVLNNQTYDHIEYWFKTKKSIKENINFDSVVSVHYLLLKFLGADDAINKPNLFRFYCITHGLPIPKPDEFSRIYQYKEIAKKIQPDNYKPELSECKNIIAFFDSFSRRISNKKYLEFIRFLKTEIKNDKK